MSKKQKIKNKYNNGYDSDSVSIKKKLKKNKHNTNRESKVVQTNLFFD